MENHFEKTEAKSSAVTGENLVRQTFQNEAQDLLTASAVKSAAQYQEPERKWCFREEDWGSGPRFKTGLRYRAFRSTVSPEHPNGTCP
jgi:hypothetical protein